MPSTSHPRAPSGSPVNFGRAPDLEGIEDLWALTLGHPDVCIALLDGPVDRSHPCFDGARLSEVETLVPGAPDEGAATRHGTHVASLVFGRHGGPVAGVAPGCRGLVLPVFSSRDDGSVTPCSQVDLARAITRAVDLGARVVNVSGGQPEPSGEAHPILRRAVDHCLASGVLLVAAAGNDGCDCLHVPAAVPGALVVGAMDTAGSPLQFSNWGERYRSQGVLAPGAGVLGAVPGGGVEPRTGTSYATALVSGVAALLLSLQLTRHGALDAAAVRAAILGAASGCDVIPASDCRRLLAGRLDVRRTLVHLMKGAAMETTDHPGPEGPPDAPEAPTLGPSGNDEPPRPEAAEASESPRPEPAGPETPEPQGVEAAGCGCGGGSGDSGGCTCKGTVQVGSTLVYALGQLTHDFGTQARRDSFVQQGLSNPDDPASLLAHLDDHPASAAAVTWVLVQETVPIYAIRPDGSFAEQGYARLREFLHAQHTQGSERVSIPGRVVGRTRLLSGEVVPVIFPELRGMYSWTTPALLEAVLGKAPSKKEEREAYDKEASEVSNFLERVYYESRNLGLAAPERALNFAATNAFQVSEVYRSAIEHGLRLDAIETERSPICRPESDCWDVRLTFFNPAKRLEQAREVYRFTVDVSDVVPVTVGKVRHWYVY